MEIKSKGLKVCMIEEEYKGLSFSDMIKNDLKGVKYPSQEKDEILFELLTNISSQLDVSEGNLRRLEVLKERWFIAQKEESRPL